MNVKQTIALAELIRLKTGHRADIHRQERTPYTNYLIATNRSGSSFKLSTQAQIRKYIKDNTP